MRQETFALSQKELQRVSVISQCVQGRPGVCQSRGTARAIASADQTLKARYRQGSAAALAHANRGRPSHRRLPQRVRQPHPASGPHPLCRLQRSSPLRKACRARGLLAQPRNPAPPAAPAKASARPANAALPLIASAVCAPLAKANWCNSTARPHDWLEGRGPRLTALGMQDDATGKILAAQFFPSETALGYLRLLAKPAAPPRRARSLSTAITAASSFATTTTGPSKNNSPENASPLSSAAPSINSASPSSPPAAPQAKGRVERLWGVLQDRLTSELRLAQACDMDSANAVLRKFIADYNRRFARRPRETANAWRPAPENLERICCFVHERIVSNDNVVQWDGRRFQIPQQAPALQLCRSQSPPLSSSRRPRLALLRRHPPANTPTSQG